MVVFGPVGKDLTYSNIYLNYMHGHVTCAII